MNGQITIREGREARRYIELWVQQNIDAPNNVFIAAYFAWNAMLVADRADNAADFVQEQHRGYLRKFRDILTSWPIYE